jgi:hypothetical protein
MITKFKKPVAASGSTIENEPVIKSDGASSDVMEWQASTGSSRVEIREDSSNNLKLEVDGIPVASGLAGIDAAGLHFDGAAGTYVDCTDTTILDGATKISLEVIAATSGTSLAIFIGKEWASDCVVLRGNADGTVAFKVNNGISTVTATSSGTYNDGNPKHIVGTWDNATLSIYVNGNLDGTATLAGGSIPNTTDKWALGAGLKSDGTNGKNLDGILYRARLFNYVIDPTRFYENATVPFADQYGSQTELITSATNRTFASGTGNWTAVSVGQTNDAGALKVDQALVYDGTGSVAGFGNRLYLAAANFTTSTPGKKYRLQFDAKAETGGSKLYATLQGSTTLDNISNTLTTSFATYVCEFDTPVAATYFVLGLGAAEAYWLDNISFTEIGCVSDYDLAFANPTQSDQVQDRSTNGVDGTASSGVTQVTPIVQVNATAARIGTSAATPADGDLAVSGKAGIGGSPTHLLDVGDYAGTTNGTENTMRCSGKQTGASNVFANLRLSNSSDSGGSYFGIAAQRDSNNYGVTANFTVNNTGAGATPLTAMSLRYDGLATFSNGIAVTTGGIKFPATQSASADANTLDDYEEGTWTPTLVCAGSGTATVASGNNTCRYTRVGNLVHIQGQFSVDAVSSPLGDLSITGLPFTVNNNTAGEQSGYTACNMRFYNLTGTSIGSNNSYFAVNTTYIVVRGFNGLTGVSTVSANLQANTYIMIGASYTV